MPAEEIITYEKLYEILRQEKNNDQMQSLDAHFFSQLTAYLQEKEVILQNQETKGNIFGEQQHEKTKKQLENIRKIIKDIYEKRENKILQLAILHAREFTNLPGQDRMLPEEEALFKKATALFRSFREDVLHLLLLGKLPQLRAISSADEKSVKEIDSKIMVRFLEPVPQFLDTELRKHGPFEAEEIANLPKQISELLIKKKKAEAM